MSPSTDISDTISIWVIMQLLKDKYRNDEVISRLANTLGTPINDHYSLENGKQATVNMVIVVDSFFRFPRSMGILVVDDEGAVRTKEMALHYPCTPAQCDFCCRFGHYMADCNRYRRRSPMLVALTTVAGDRRPTPQHPLGNMQTYDCSKIQKNDWRGVTTRKK